MGDILAKAPWKSKTVWFFGLYLLVGVARVAGFDAFTPTTEQLEIGGIVIALAGLVLRWFTNRPVSLRDHE